MTDHAAKIEAYLEIVDSRDASKPSVELPAWHGALLSELYCARDHFQARYAKHCNPDDGEYADHLTTVLRTEHERIMREAAK